jgi:hypothetical protein
MRETSVKYMGSLRYNATFYGRTRITRLPEEEDKAIRVNGDSYLNDTLSVAVGLRDDEGVYINRSWPVPKSASVTATNIRHGRIPGQFKGQKDRFQVKVVPDPDRPEEFTCLVRERRGREGYW